MSPGLFYASNMLDVGRNAKHTTVVEETWGQGCNKYQCAHFTYLVSRTEYSTQNAKKNMVDCLNNLVRSALFHFLILSEKKLKRALGTRLTVWRINKHKYNLWLNTKHTLRESWGNCHIVWCRRHHSKTPISAWTFWRVKAAAYVCCWLKRIQNVFHHLCSILVSWL